MKHKASKKPSVAHRPSSDRSDFRRAKAEVLGRFAVWAPAIVCLLWVITAASISSRMQLVLGYATFPVGPPQLELFLASSAAWLFSFAVVALWFSIATFQWRQRQRRRQVSVATIYMTVGLIPLVLSIARILGMAIPALYWEALWISFWTGLSFVALTTEGLEALLQRVPGFASVGVLSALTIALASWWFYQSLQYYSNFQLGFNDFGHFGQRIANSAAGRGLLLETPVLPMFWDHFNPGLLLLVPLWKLFPSVYLLFVLQAGALAGSAFFVWGIARRLDYNMSTASLFGCAWLVQPILGQMNLAYTYGWHPVSLAIPLMLAALWALLAGRKWLSLGAICSAMSMEEGVIVVACLFCLGCAAQSVFRSAQDDTKSVLGNSGRIWILGALVCFSGFVLVYLFSGIAEFQTGRFVALGNGPVEVILSPLLRPSAFWGQIFRWEKLAFVLSLWLPCYAMNLIRGWRWLLPTFLPLLVLIVWDHKPATSLALQYPSTLLPVFWFAALVGGRDSRISSACGALATGLVLSLFVGQLPYSNMSSLLGVVAQSYGAGLNMRLQARDEDGRWLTEQIMQVRAEDCEVLATGRIASHFVGMRDIETVGQFVQRREKLAQLADRRGKPIEHYQWLILDRLEEFQQTREETEAVEAEARQSGFKVFAEKFDIVLLRRAAD